MPEQKKRTTIWIAKHVLRELKFLGVEHDKPIGEVIEALVNFAKADAYVNDPAWVKRFQALREMAFANTGLESAIVEEPRGGEPG